MAVTDTLDRLMTRLLWVTPQPPAEDAPESAPQERNLGLALVISALRCTLQYMILPVVLPLVGLVGSFSLAIVILLDFLAIGLLVSSLRYFWRTRHPRRFDILPLTATILLVVLGSLGYDLWGALR